VKNPASAIHSPYTVSKQGNSNNSPSCGRDGRYWDLRGKLGEEPRSLIYNQMKKSRGKTKRYSLNYDKINNEGNKMIKEKTKVEFEYVELEENEIIKFHGDFWKINCKSIQDWKDRKYDMVKLTKIKNLKELESLEILNNPKIMKEINKQREREKTGDYSDFIPLKDLKVN